jgi:hypothetical protein
VNKFIWLWSFWLLFYWGDVCAELRPGQRTIPNFGDRVIKDSVLREEIQPNKKPLIMVFSGFIRHEIIFDTRQVVNAREGLVSLYPENIRLDAKGKDVNARHSFNMLGIHSRIKATIHGPNILKAKTQGVVEADFYGNENKNFSDLNGLRLFNAYINFRWESIEALVGQYWHPMSVPEYFPRVVSFSAGAPFHPMSRNPQVRFQYKLRSLKLIGVLLSQRDFTSTGPDGPGSQYLRNAGIPNAHLQIHYGSDSSIVSAGVGIDYKKLIPELFVKNVRGEILSTRQSVASTSMVGFLNFRARNLSLRTQGVYAQNGYDLLMLGGYAERGIVNGETGEKVFSNLAAASVWADMQSNRGTVRGGLFAGTTTNLGSARSITGNLYSRGTDVLTIYRIAPRLIYLIEPLSVSLEAEYTMAKYGLANGNGKGKVVSGTAVSNFRSVLSLKYSF